PILIPREGSAFHDASLPFGNVASPPAVGTAALPGANPVQNNHHLPFGNVNMGDDAFAVPAPSPASATAIRGRLAEAVLAYGANTLSLAQLSAIGMAAYIPAAALPWLADTPLVSPRDAAPVQLALLRRASLESLQALPDMTEGLEYRVLNAAGKANSLEEFYYRMKTKRYTLTRLQRMAAHLLIDYRQEHAAALREGPPYLRILGANSTGHQLIRRIRKTAPLPVITRTSQMKALAKESPHAASAWDIELRATAMHSLLSGSDFSEGNPEYFLSTITMP
ncbi:MAG: nucleotidyltransferase family protein, partial [Clostridiales bacterium]|nr:nucleotidyltransferase family protein [Clostridiales bacterium]